MSGERDLSLGFIEGYHEERSNSCWIAMGSVRESEESGVCGEGERESGTVHISRDEDDIYLEYTLRIC